MDAPLAIVPRETSPAVEKKFARELSKSVPLPTILRRKRLPKLSLSRTLIASVITVCVVSVLLVTVTVPDVWSSGRKFACTKSGFGAKTTTRGSTAAEALGVKPVSVATNAAGNIKNLRKFFI